MLGNFPLSKYYPYFEHNTINIEKKIELSPRYPFYTAWSLIIYTLNFVCKTKIQKELLKPQKDTFSIGNYSSSSRVQIFILLPITIFSSRLDCMVYIYSM